MRSASQRGSVGHGGAVAGPGLARSWAWSGFPFRSSLRDIALVRPETARDCVFTPLARTSSARQQQRLQSLLPREAGGDGADVCTGTRLFTDHRNSLKQRAGAHAHGKLPNRQRRLRRTLPAHHLSRVPTIASH